MADSVVTELVIDSKTDGADQFSQAMDKAGSSAEKGSTSVAGMTLAIAGVGVAVIGAIAGLRSFIDYVGQQSHALVDMATHAELAGMSTREFQQTLFAARASGLTEKDFVAGLDKISADLTQAGQGVTEFSKLFAANEVSLRNQNGQLKTAKDALVDIMDLMQGATPQVQQRIAQIVGVTKDWIPFLKQGEDAFEAQKKLAADLGIIIDDSTISKAKQFNTEWKTAVAAWDLQFKASLASILPLLVQAANLASKIIEGIGGVSGTVGRWNTADDDKTKAQLNDQINDVARLRDMVEQIGDIGTNSFKGLQARNLAGLVGLPENASIAQIDALLDKLSTLYDKKPVTVPIYGGASDTVLPKNNDPKDQLDRSIDAVQRHIALMNADAQAVGQTAAAQAGLRTEAELYAAAERAGFTDLEKFADKFYALREQMEGAKAAFDKLKIASDIKFGTNTALLSPQDAQIAQQLRTIYPDVTQALNSAEAAQIRFNNTLKDTSTAFQNSAGPALLDFEMGIKSGKDALVDFEKQFIRSLLNIINQMLIFTPIAKALQGAISGFGFGGAFNANSAVPGAAKDAVAGGFHSGGIVGAEPTFSRAIHPAYFDEAPRFHGGGIAGDEVPIIARKGEGVFTQGQMAALGRGSDAVTVNVLNAPPGTNANATTSRASNGDLQIDVMLDGAVAKNMANPGSATRRITDSRNRLASR